jgi:hypothetical protein
MMLRFRLFYSFVLFKYILIVFLYILGLYVSFTRLYFILSLYYWSILLVLLTLLLDRLLNYWLVLYSHWQEYVFYLMFQFYFLIFVNNTCFWCTLFGWINYNLISILSFWIFFRLFLPNLINCFLILPLLSVHILLLAFEMSCWMFDCQAAWFQWQVMALFFLFYLMTKLW